MTSSCFQLLPKILPLVRRNQWISNMIRWYTSVNFIEDDLFCLKWFQSTSNESWGYIETTLIQRCGTLFGLCFNVGYWRCVNVVQRLKSDVRFCFIFNVRSTLLELWSTVLKQRWSDVEMLVGKALWNLRILTDSKW